MEYSVTRTAKINH